MEILEHTLDKCIFWQLLKEAFGCGAVDEEVEGVTGSHKRGSEEERRTPHVGD